MQQLEGVRPQAHCGLQPLARDLAVLLGFSAALAVAAGVVRTPMGVPGHSAVYRMAILVLAGSYRRPGMAVGTALCGGALATLWVGFSGGQFAGLLASGAVVEALGIGGSPGPSSLRLLLAGVLGNFGKLAIKILATTSAGLPLNHALIPLLPTIGLYTIFGVIGGAVAWGALSSCSQLRRWWNH